MRLLGRILGIALCVFGAMWALQGLGLLNWPAQSVMLADTSWAIYGAICLVIGLGVLMWMHRSQ